MNKFKRAIKRCKQHRLQILELSQKVQALHVGGSFSSVEIVDCIYNILKKKNDKFILSKGHAGIIQYVVLNQLGVISKRKLNSYCQKNGYGFTKYINRKYKLNKNIKIYNFASYAPSDWFFYKPNTEYYEKKIILLNYYNLSVNENGVSKVTFKNKYIGNKWKPNYKCCKMKIYRNNKKYI